MTYGRKPWSLGPWPLETGVQDRPKSRKLGSRRYKSRNLIFPSREPALSEVEGVAGSRTGLWGEPRLPLQIRWAGLKTRPYAGVRYVARALGSGVIQVGGFENPPLRRGEVRGQRLAEWCHLYVERGLDFGGAGEGVSFDS